MAKKKKENKESAFDKLSDKHKLFVMNYIKNFGNATKAYLDTYTTSAYDSARVDASKLLTKSNVKQAIDEEYAKRFKEIQTETEKTKTYQLIKAVADTSIDEVIDMENGTLIVKSLSEIPSYAKHAIQNVELIEKSTPNGVDRTLKVKLHSKLQALKLRAEIQRLIDPKNENQQLEIIIKPAVRPDKKQSKNKEEGVKNEEIIKATRPE